MPSTRGGGRADARRALRLLDRHPSCFSAGEMGPGDRLARPRAAAGRTRGRTASSGATCCCPSMFQHEAAGDFDGAAATAAAAAEIGERFGDADLFALATFTSRATSWCSTGGCREGLALLDEAMVAVDGGRAVADRHRDRLLRRDHDLRGGLRRCAAHGSGRTPCAAGASSSPTWWPSPAAASSIALRSCSSTAPGRTRSRRRTRADRRFERAANQPAAAQSALPAGRGLPAARRRRRGRGGLPARRASTALEPQPGWSLLRLAQGKARRRGRRDPASARRDDRQPAQSARAPARLRRDHARGRRARGGPRREPTS